jgi:hypothetical protein
MRLAEVELSQCQCVNLLAASSSSSSCDSKDQSKEQKDLPQTALGLMKKLQQHLFLEPAARGRFFDYLLDLTPYEG